MCQVDAILARVSRAFAFVGVVQLLIAWGIGVPALACGGCLVLSFACLCWMGLIETQAWEEIEDDVDRRGSGDERDSRPYDSC